MHFFLKIISVLGWSYPQVQNPQLWSSDCNYKYPVIDIQGVFKKFMEHEYSGKNYVWISKVSCQNKHL